MGRFLKLWSAGESRGRSYKLCTGMIFPRSFDVSYRLYAAGRRYAKDLIALGTAKAYLKLSRILTFLFSSLLWLLGGVLFLGMLTVALALWLGEVLRSYPLGFIISAAIWFCVVLLFYLLRHALFTKPLMKRLYRGTVGKSARSRKIFERGAPEEPPYRSPEALRKHTMLLQKRMELQREYMATNLGQMKPAAINDAKAWGTMQLLRFGQLFLFKRIRRNSRRRRRA